MKISNNKKAVADYEDPIFWGVSTLIYLVVLVAVWKLSMGSETDITRMKVIFSIVAIPIVYGMSYLVGGNG